MSKINLVKGLVAPDVPTSGQISIFALTDGELYTRNDNGTVQLLSGLSDIVQDDTPQLGGDLDAAGFAINNLLDPVSAQDAATKNYVDEEIIALGAGTHLSNVVEDTSPQLGGNLDVNGFRITGIDIVLNANNDVDVMSSKIINLGTPTISTDATTKGYVDGLFATAATSGIDNIVEDTTPQLGGQLDVNGFDIGDGTNVLLSFLENPLAANNIEIENAATSFGPILRSVGSDSNIDLILESQGTGDIKPNRLVWPSGITGSRPIIPEVGQIFFDTTLGLPIWFDGTNWIDAAGTIV